MEKTGAEGITGVPGIEVGHATDSAGLTGCTVVLCRQGAVAGVDVRGSAPATRETDLLRSENLVEQAHAVLLTGGSAFGLNAAAGVMRYLEERDIGFDAGVARVPIVPAAAIFDLGIGDSKARPDAEMGYAACRAAGAGVVAEGNVGAGAGATVGKLYGMSRAMKGGVGTALRQAGELLVGAIVVVNPFGDVVDPATGQIIAGTRRLRGAGFADTTRAMAGVIGRAVLGFAGNTIVGVVATNARLSKAQANKVAQMAHDGLARVIRPAHTMFDGDALFTLATGESAGDVTLVGALAAEAVAEAIVRGVRAAQSAGGAPAVSDLK